MPYDFCLEYIYLFTVIVLKKTNLATQTEMNSLQENNRIFSLQNMIM